VVSADPTEPQATVVVIDDDASMREALGSLLASVGLQSKLLASVADFVKSGRPAGPTCLVLDVGLPGLNGLDFQRELAAANIHLPIVFITGDDDISKSIQALKDGAIEFLTKPFQDQDLLDAIGDGLARDRARLDSENANAPARA